MSKKSLIALIGSMVICIVTAAFGVKSSKTELDYLAFRKPQLRVTEVTENSRALGESFQGNAAAERFIKDHGGNWTFTIDRRRGVFALIEGGALSMIPGARSSVKWEDFAPSCRKNDCLRVADVETASRDFMTANPDLFPVKQEELVLDPEGSGPFGESIYFISFQWAPGGVPVEGGRIAFRFNGGNLIQLSTSAIGILETGTVPSISVETAEEVFSGYIGGLSPEDEMLDEGSLLLVPVVPTGEGIENYRGVPGKGISYALAYRFVFRREGVTGTWEGLVDANNGEILRFGDMNRYGSVHGVVYPGDNHNNQQDRPFPYVATGLPSPNQYSDIGGRFYGDSATLNLGQGKYTKIVDTCGPTTLTTADGDADYGESVGQDCGTPNPNPAGAGNTYSSKVQYYHLTLVNIKARSYFPSNSWLNNSYITVNVNDDPLCNAMSGGESLYFYKASSGCWNLGEIPGVSLHEWGHSFDNYDGSGGDSPPLETRADWTATLQLHDSCTGRGAWLGDNCYGYGDACTDCDGIRDADYAKHAKNTPWTAANNGSVYNCSSGSYNGPCGWEDHCESGISTQALWDLVTRDLPAYCGMDSASAWQLVDRLSYLSMAQLGNMYTCDGSAKTSSGCAGNTLYTLFRALDDDGDGVSNGTPHAAAIFAALNRHNIACGSAGDAANQNQSSCPTLATPVLTGVAGSEAVTLTSSAVPYATRYIFYRNEMNCEAGYTKIGTVYAPATSFLDSTPVNGMTYYYRVQAATDTDACLSQMSNCLTITPQPCTGMLILDKSLVGCGVQTVSVTLLDSTVTAPVGITVFSTSHPSPVGFSLTNTPAGSATYLGSFQTTTGTAGAGQVAVQAGDTVTVRYTDPDYCGEVNHDVDVSFPVDCVPPVITNVRVSAKTDTTATISWTTDEPANSRVYYGLSSPPSSVAENLTSYSTQHNLTITGLSGCTVYYFYVGSYDGAQNYSEETNSGAYYSFRTGTRVYGYGPFNVESGTTGWSMTGSWHRDTCKAHGGTYSFKSGSTTCPGTQPVSTTSDLSMIADINLGSAGHGYHLRFWEYYATESGYDYCKVQVSTTGGNSWQDLASSYSGSSGGWNQKDYDLSAFSGNVRFRFESTTDQYQSYEGWYVDDIEISGSVDCAPVLNVESFSFADDCVGTGGGDGDGSIDPGEEATVTVTLRNEGYFGATNVWAEMSSPSPEVTVPDAVADFPDMAIGASGTSLSNHFKARFSQSIPCGTVVPMTLTVHSAEGNWTDTIDLAAGHYVNPVSALVTESFDGSTFPPSGWAEKQVTGTTGDWARSTGTVRPTGGGTHSGAGLAYYRASQTGNTARLYRTAGSLIPSTAVSATVSFWMYHDTGSTNADKISVQVSTNGTTWSAPGGNTFGRYDGSVGWKRHTVDVSSYIGSAIMIGFFGTSALGNYCHIDDVELSYEGAAVCVTNACTPSCVTPSAPAITGISDDDGCLQSGITVSFTAGSPAVSHDLYRDGAVVLSGVTSPVSHDPGDTATHNYKVRAVNGECFTDSGVQGYADGTCSVPPEVAGGDSAGNIQGWSEDKATQSWPTAAGATGYRLYRGTLADLPNLTGVGTDSCTRYDGTGTSVDLSADDPSVVAGSFYWYIVTANNGAGEGTPGNGRTVNSTGACAP